jgi:hypothetical protein
MKRTASIIKTVCYQLVGLFIPDAIIETYLHKDRKGFIDAIAEVMKLKFFK